MRSRLVEEVRAAAKDLRADSSPEAARRLRDRLGEAGAGGPPDLDPGVQRLFRPDEPGRAAGRVRAIRAHARAADPSPSGREPRVGPPAARDRGIDADQIAEHLDRALICPVFTAHPSEARRRTILEKLSSIARELDRLEDRRDRPDRPRAGRCLDRRGGRDPLAVRHHPRDPADRRGRGQAGARRGRGEPPGGRPPGLSLDRGRAGPSLSRSRLARSPRSSGSARGSAATATATRASRRQDHRRARSGSSRKAS